MGSFNIGSQNAASIVNVDGDMTVQGGIHASAAWEVHQLRTAVGRLQDEVAGLPLAPPVEAEIARLLAAASAEAGTETPDKRRVADLLTSMTGTLKEAGALATAGTGLVESLRAAAAVLGPLGAAVLALL